VSRREGESENDSHFALRRFFKGRVGLEQLKGVIGYPLKSKLFQLKQIFSGRDQHV
jgi:hypothetical protein